MFARAIRTSVLPRVFSHHAPLPATQIRQKHHKKPAKHPSTQAELAQEDIEDDLVSMAPRTKRRGITTQEVEQLHMPGSYNEDTLAKEMEKAIEHFQIALKTVVGRVGRLEASYLDGVKVELHGQRSPLQDYANVSVRNGESLIISLYDPSTAKDVEKALRATPDMDLNPQVVDHTTLKIFVPKADLKTRTAMAKKAADLAEHARIAIRSSRTTGQKELKKDESDKIVSKEVAKSLLGELTERTKKKTEEVDTLLAKAKKVLMDE